MCTGTGPKRRPSSTALMWIVAALLLIGMVTGCESDVTPTGPVASATAEPLTDMPAPMETPIPTEVAAPTVEASPSATPVETAPAPTAGPSETPAPTPAAVSSLPPTSFVRAADAMKMLRVEEGPFLMGSAEGDPRAAADEMPQHQVRLDGFYIDKYEVSNAQYKLCVALGACDPPTTCAVGAPTYLLPGSQDEPVVCVSWSDAQAYCVWADGRLPTEAEWEKAARGTGGRIYPWGDEPTCGTFNYCDAACPYFADPACTTDPYPEAASVWAYPQGASPYGLFNMAGNVMEWVNDWYEAAYYAGSPASNPPGPPASSQRVLRGGSWNLGSVVARSARRFQWSPGTRMEHYGFRCASTGVLDSPQAEQVMQDYFTRAEEASKTMEMASLLDLFSEDAVVEVPLTQTAVSGTLAIEPFYKQLIGSYLQGLRPLSLDVWTRDDQVMADFAFTSDTVTDPMAFHHAAEISGGLIRHMRIDIVMPPVLALVGEYFALVQQASDNAGTTCQPAQGDLAAVLGLFADDATVEVPIAGLKAVGMQELGGLYPQLIGGYLCGLRGAQKGGVIPADDRYLVEYWLTSYAITQETQANHWFQVTSDFKIRSLVLDIIPPSPVVQEYYEEATLAAATGDVGTLVGLFADGATVEIPSSQRRARGAAEITALYQDLLGGYLHGLQFGEPDLSSKGTSWTGVSTVTSDEIGVPVTVTQLFEVSEQGDRIVSLSLDLPDTPEQQLVVRYFVLAEKAAADPSAADLGPALGLFADNATMDVPPMDMHAAGKEEIARLYMGLINTILAQVKGKLAQVSVQGNLVIGDYVLKSAQLPQETSIRHTFMLANGKIQNLLIDVTPPR